MTPKRPPSAASPAAGTGSWTAELPAVAGGFALDQAALRAAATDFGRMVSAEPIAVLSPATAQDVVAAVRFARRHRLSVAARGMAHSAGGQSLVRGGLVVAMRSLGRILAVDTKQGFADVEAGALWSEVAAATLAVGLRPPVLPDWLEMTVGGTLSFGGIGAESFRAGLQSDHVRELDVVTGTGELLTCSPTENQALFDSARAGLGQFGIITRARIALVPAPAEVALDTMLYADLASFLQDLNLFTADPRVDGLRAHFLHEDSMALRQLVTTVPAALRRPGGASAGGWLPRLELTRYCPPPGVRVPDRPVGLSTFQGTTRLAYADYVSRVPPIMLREQQQGPQLHPEIALLVPGAQALDFLATTLSELVAADLGGALLLVPLLRAAVSTPAFCCPPGEHFLLFTVLRSVPPSNQDHAARLARHNAVLAERGQRQHAGRYVADSLESLTGEAAWKRHFAASWAWLVEAKQRFDPDHLLTPGLNIFPRMQRREL